MRVRAPRFVVTSLARTSSVSANISNALGEERILNSVLDRHRVDTRSGSEFPYADPDADPDWHPNDADPHADPTSSFTHVENPKFFFIIFSHSFAGLQCFIFLSSVKVKDVISLRSTFHMPGTDTDTDRPDTDRHALDADSDLDPAK